MKPPPKSSGGPTNPDAKWYFVIREIATTDNNNVPYGYDLDGHCTFLADGAITDSPCKNSPVDADGGIDNGILKYLARVPTPPNTPDGGFTAAVNADFARGLFGVFIALSNYNNTPNDDSVEVRVLPSQGFERIGCDSGAADKLPRWEGCDLWKLEEVPDTGTYLDTTLGYVTDGVLVVPHKGKLILQIGTLPLPVIDAVLTARIEDAGAAQGGLRLADGRIVGRIDPADLLQAAGEYFVNLPQFNIVGPVCNFPPLYNDLAAKICGARDIPLQDTPQSREQQCNAISMGFAFNAVAVPLGVPGGPAPPPVCPLADAHCDDD